MRRWHHTGHRRARRQLGGLSRAVGLERRVKKLELSLAQGSRAINGVNSQDGVWLVKILSIRQPWAYLITRGSKDIENRSWPTKYRGPFLVHASLRVEKKACLDHGLDPTKLQTGRVVGIAEITDGVQRHRSKWFVGPYGFVLKKRRRLQFEKRKGALGL